jgi:hypothetical protein
MLVGGAGGAIRSGRFLQVAPATPITNLYVSMLARTLAIAPDKPNRDRKGAGAFSGL